jgi:hypothetical protein
MTKGVRLVRFMAKPTAVEHGRVSGSQAVARRESLGLRSRVLPSWVEWKFLYQPRARISRKSARNGANGRV